MRQTTCRKRPARIRAQAGWAALYAWQVERAAATPIFRQVYLQMRSAILGQRLSPGAKLPSTRALAAKLGVARTSVISAYEQLLRRRLSVRPRQAPGTYISGDLPEPVERLRPGRGKAARAPAALSSQARAFAVLGAIAVEDEDHQFTNARVLIDARTMKYGAG